MGHVILCVLTNLDLDTLELEKCCYITALHARKWSRFICKVAQDVRWCWVSLTEERRRTKTDI